jgi:hypothetical protein
MGSREFTDVGSRWMDAMRRGDFSEAWRQTDRIESARRERQARGEFRREPYHLVWDGTPLDNRDLLVRCEHGLGDTIQFIRYLPRLRRVARSVTVLVQPHLLNLLKKWVEDGLVRDGWTDEPEPAHDVEIEVMELAYAFRSTIETLPSAVPYLPLDAAHARLPLLPREAAATSLRVGLVWAASEWDTSRSIPVELLSPLASARNVVFYSLQQGERADDWQRTSFPLVSLSARTRDIAAAAAAMIELDLVVTVDNMVAHLAGALGRPVWVVLRHDADWRWMSDRADSPWYPTMRLFRQNTSRGWRAVVHEVCSALEELEAASLGITRTGTSAHSTA